MSNPQPKIPVLLLRSTSRNFPLDLVPELERAGHGLHAVESLEDFIASPLRAKPFLAVLEIGHLADLDRALIVFDWTEQMQPLAPARYLLLLSSKNITLGEKAMRFGSAEVATLPQPARNVLFKLELQSRLLASQTAEKNPARGFSAQLEEGAGKRRILVARGQDEKAGSWRMGESTPQGKIRWRWIRNPERETPGEKEEFHWLAEAQQEPHFDKKLDAWVIEGDTPNLLCFRGEAQLFSAVPSVAPEAKPGTPATPAGQSATEAKPAAKEEKAGAPARPAQPAPPKPERENPFAPKPGSAEEKEARPEVTRIAADPAPERPAAGPAGTQGAPAGKAAPSLARLFEAVKAQAAAERVAASEEGAGEEEAQRPATGAGDSSGQAFSQAGHGPRNDAPGPEAVVEPEAGAAPFRDHRVPGEKEAVPSLRRADSAPQAGKQTGNPEDFSRSAPVGSLSGQGTQGSSSAPAPGERGTEAFRGGGSTAGPFHSIPSREGAAPSSAAVHRIAGELVVPKSDAHFQGGPSGTGLTPPGSGGQGSAPTPAAPASATAPAESPAAPAPPETSAATAAPASMPSTSLPGGAFDSQLPPLGAGKPRAKLVSPGQPPSPGPTEPTASSGERTSVQGGPSLLEPEHRIRPPLSPGEGPSGTTLKGSAPTDDTTVVKGKNAVNAVNAEDGSRSFLRDRHYLLMTLNELADKESSWHPVGRYRIYLSARHRYYGLPHPGDVLPLWIYEGELAPEFIDEQKSWKFYDRLPVAVFSLETMPQEVLEYIYKMAGKELPKGEGSAVVMFPGAQPSAGAGSLTEVGGQNPDHYLAEKKKKRGAWGAVADFLKALFGGKRN